ncbi:MAG TPA: AbrB/MazE/SpoVT family DNA-binding domain-containing protein [Nitrospiraceae bacterium]|nr:AbrB/MazE/SpoVT family DNA-binding domain-containing protein [Nitrospiraceae bacterium]
MQAVLKKWGNSTAVRLPAPLVKEAKFRLNQSVEMTAEEGRIIITPRQKPVRYKLDDLLAGITPENRHDAVDMGGAVGAEEF